MSFKSNRYRDIEKWRVINNNRNKRYYSKTQNAKNSKRRWDEEDLEKLLYSDLSDTELSELIGRSVKAIQVKRSKLKHELHI